MLGLGVCGMILALIGLGIGGIAMGRKLPWGKVVLALSLVIGIASFVDVLVAGRRIRGLFREATERMEGEINLSEPDLNDAAAERVRRDMSELGLNEPARPVKPREAATSRYDPGDAVMVVAKEAKLRIGKTRLGAIPRGTRLVVKKVNAPWLGVYATVGGKRTWGWLHESEVAEAGLR